MAGQNAGKGQGNGRAGRDGRNGAGQKGHRSGYSAKPKTTKVGLCKELESNVFHYGGYNTANTMRVTQEKIQQYVGIKYGEDIANKICNKVTVVLRHHNTLMLSSIDIRSGRDTAEGNRPTFWLHSKIDSKDSKPTQMQILLKLLPPQTTLRT
jgi:hypothetical protein